MTPRTVVQCLDHNLSLLEEFIQRHEHRFSVVDEYGGFAGIVRPEGRDRENCRTVNRR